MRWRNARLDRQTAKDYIPKDAAVAKECLHCNQWIASSALQKAIRRGEIAVAERAAFALHREDSPAAWRRLIAIAFEDLGPAAVDVVVETVAVATSPDWRAVRGQLLRLSAGLPQHPRTAAPIT